MNPHIAVITGLFEPSRKFWSQTVPSILSQSDPDWQWLIMPSTQLSQKTLRKLHSLSNADSRVQCLFDSENLDFSTSLSTALSSLNPEFSAMLNQNGFLDRRCFQALREAEQDNPGSDIFYVDEDAIGLFGRRHAKTRKPVWSPEKLRGFNYLGNFVVFRTSILGRLSDLGNLSADFASYDFVLRRTEAAREVSRISHVLYHHRLSRAASNSSSPEDNRLAVHNHLKRCGIDAAVDFADNPRYLRVTRSVNNVKPISVVIPTRGAEGDVYGRTRVFVEELLKSLVEDSTALLEFVIVYDAETPDEVLANIREIAGESLQLIRYSKPFNFSSKCNLGAVNARNDTLVFLNDDMQALSQNSLANLVAPLQEPGVGMTGAKLLFENGTIQHGGHLHEYGDNRINYYGAPKNSEGANGALLINREVSGVTGACMATTKSVFDEVGGFSELFPNSYNDVDLCNKVRASGYRILWLANVEFTHFESMTRQPTVQVIDCENIKKRWGSGPDDFFT